MPTRIFYSFTVPDRTARGAAEQGKLLWQDHRLAQASGSKQKHKTTPTRHLHLPLFKGSTHYLLQKSHHKDIAYS
jgi:hypothetical protein